MGESTETAVEPEQPYRLTIQANQACQLRRDGEVGPEVLDLQVDPVDLEHHNDALAGRGSCAPL